MVVPHAGRLRHLCLRQRRYLRCGIADFAEDLLGVLPQFRSAQRGRGAHAVHQSGLADESEVALLRCRSLKELSAGLDLRIAAHLRDTVVDRTYRKAMLDCQRDPLGARARTHDGLNLAAQLFAVRARLEIRPSGQVAEAIPKFLLLRAKEQEEAVLGL